MEYELTGQSRGLTLVGRKIPTPKSSDRPFDQNMYYKVFKSKGGSTMGIVEEQAFKKVLEDAQKKVEESNARSTEQIYKEGIVDMRRTVNFLRTWANMQPKGSRSAQKALALVSSLGAVEADVLSSIEGMSSAKERRIIKQLSKGNVLYCVTCGRDTAVDNPNSMTPHCLECGNEIREVSRA